MTDEQWAAIALLLDKGFKWREPFGDVQLTAYRVLLDGYDEAQIGDALRTLVARGQVFGPTPGEIVALIRSDPSKPTFVEACRLIYGTRGILRARPTATSFADEGERGRAYNEAARARAGELHPLVGSFVDRFGIDRLRMLELEHEDYGELNRKDLERSWDAHCEAMKGRSLAALALPRGDGLRQLDPLAALGLDRPALPTSTQPLEDR